MDEYHFFFGSVFFTVSQQAIEQHGNGIAVEGRSFKLFNGPGTEFGFYTNVHGKLLGCRNVSIHGFVWLPRKNGKGYQLRKSPGWQPLWDRKICRRVHCKDRW